MTIQPLRFGANLNIRIDKAQKDPVTVDTAKDFFMAMHETDLGPFIQAIRDERDPLDVNVTIGGNYIRADMKTQSGQEDYFTKKDDEFIEDYLKNLKNRITTFIGGVIGKLEARENLSRSTRRLISQLKADLDADDFQSKGNHPGRQSNEVNFHCKSSQGATIVLGGKEYDVDKTVTNGEETQFTLESSDKQTLLKYFSTRGSLNSISAKLDGGPEMNLVEMARNGGIDTTTVLQLSKQAGELFGALDRKGIF